MDKSIQWMFLFLKEKLPFLLSFLFCKGMVFLVPLLMAEILSAKNFGTLEYALAGMGFVLNALINLGVAGGYPYFVLRQKETNIINGFAIHFLWLGLLFVINQIAFLFFNLSVAGYMVLNVSFIIANQVFFSTELKSHEKPIKAIFFDSGMYLVLFIVYLLFRLEYLQTSVDYISLFLLIYASVYFVNGIRLFIKADKANILSHYGKILKYSINIMLGSFLIFLFTASGRILVEYFFGYEEVAGYGYYFRISAVSIMIFQMVSILYFKQIYTYAPERLDRYYSIFFVAMSALSVMLFFISPLILGLVSQFFLDTFNKYRGVYFLLSFQMIMWIATALNSNIIDRENLAKKNNLWFSGLVVISITILFCFQNIISLDYLVLTHFTIIFLAALIQYRSLYCRKIYFKRSIFVLVFLYLIALTGFLTGIYDQINY